MTVTHQDKVDDDYEAATDGARHEHHPSDGLYWKVGGALGLITALEVGTYFITDDPYSHDLKWLLIGSLIFMMITKFVVIVAYFMHVKFDNRLFRNVFVSGLVLAVGVYIAMLTAFEFWDDNHEDAGGGEAEVQVEEGA